MKMLAVIILLIFPVPIASKLDWLLCPKAPPVENFDLDRFMGTWYEATKFPGPFQKNLRCVTYQFSKKDDGGLKATTCGVNKDNKLDEKEGEAYQPKKGEGTLKIRFSKFMMYKKFKVIKTDYDNYALLYACMNFGLFHCNKFWILVRDRSYATDRYLALLKENAKDAGIKTEFLVPMNNTNCIDH